MGAQLNKTWLIGRVRRSTVPRIGYTAWVAEVYPAGKDPAMHAVYREFWDNWREAYDDVRGYVDANT